MEILNKMEMNLLVILTIFIVLIAVFGGKIVMKPPFCNFLNICARKIFKIVLEIPNKMEMDWLGISIFKLFLLYPVVHCP